MTHHILTLQCPDRPGIVAALARGIGRADGNILDSAQFSDPGTGDTFTIEVDWGEDD